MKKTIAIILAAVLVLAYAYIPAFADETSTVSIVMSEQGYDNGKAVESVSSGSVSIVFAKNDGTTAPTYYTNSTGGAVRVYAKGSITVSAGEGNIVKSVILTVESTNSKGIGALTADSGELTFADVVGTWTGSASSVVFTNASGQARIVSAEISYAAGTAADPEPTEPAVTVPSTPEEIVKALYALAQGETLAGGPYTLTGTVTKVNTAYNAEKKNVTVTIAVEGLEDYPVQCFRMKGEGADVIGVDYVITVTGTLKDYKGTKEFDSGCTLDSYTAPATEPEEPAQPELTTPEEIVKALYALAQGETLYGGPYTLTGKVTSVDTAYNSEYENVTVTMVVEGLEDYPIKCYRLKGTGADVIGVDYTITVTGTLKNYKGTKEYDAGCTLDSYTAPEVVIEQPELTTPEEILTALYALEKGETLYGGPYTLTGKITAVNTVYSSQWENITVTIVVEGFENYPVQCYRMKGEGADIIDVDDTITVTGYLKDYNGTKEYDAGCTLDSYTHVEKEKEDVSKLTPEEILNRLYALNDGETLTDVYTLTGKIISVDTAWNSEYGNITVTIEVEGYPDKPVMCYRLQGEGADGLAVNDVITVAGTFKNYKGTYEFNQGCELLNVVKAPAEENVQTGDCGYVLALAVVAVVALGGCLVLRKKIAE